MTVSMKVQRDVLLGYISDSYKREYKTSWRVDEEKCMLTNGKTDIPLARIGLSTINVFPYLESLNLYNEEMTDIFVCTDNIYHSWNTHIYTSTIHGFTKSEVVKMLPIIQNKRIYGAKKYKTIAFITNETVEILRVLRDELNKLQQ